jgi:hypothetical protein
MVITEKLDGTNAQVIIEPAIPEAGDRADTHIAEVDGLYIGAGSRTRLLWPGKTTDNFGFAQWVADNAAELVKLGPGRHFGEWYGQGIQRGYGLTEKRFALFNVGRWNAENKPACCEVVPVLSRYTFDTNHVGRVMEQLRVQGSFAVPGFMKPEGIVVFHTASGALFKKTFEKDETGKEAA